MIFKNHASTCQKEKIESIKKARRKTSRNKFVEKSGMPDRVESFRDIATSKDCPGGRLGLVKPIRNRLRKMTNLIQSRPSRVGTALAGRENEVWLHKEE